MANLGPEAVTSTCLGHSRAREGKEMKNERRVSEVKEKKWDGFEMKMKGGEGGGGLNKWV